MELSPPGLALLKASEGFRSRVYLDVNGFPTIAYGHRLIHPESFPNGVGQAQASEILMADIRDAEQSVHRMVKVTLTQGQFDALVDFVFNMGSGRLYFSKLLVDLNAGRFEDAANQLLLWDHAGTKENAGLKARRNAEFQLFSPAAAVHQAVA